MEIKTIEPFLEYLAKVRERTERVVAAIPPEQIEWTYAPGRFTFGDLIRHLAAIERYMFVENVSGRPSIYPGHGRELAEGHEAVLAYFKDKHAESLELLARLTPEDLARRCQTPGGASLPAWKWLRSMVEHEIHHRGQIYIYLGLLGVAETPRLYGLTEEEVKARSLS
jgi:uncharacterized damage-inducible protein DinB